MPESGGKERRGGWLWISRLLTALVLGANHSAQTFRQYQGCPHHHSNRIEVQYNGFISIVDAPGSVMVAGQAYEYVGINPIPARELEISKLKVCRCKTYTHVTLQEVLWELVVA
jgi:hypothetical protein